MKFGARGLIRRFVKLWRQANTETNQQADNKTDLNGKTSKSRKQITRKKQRNKQQTIKKHKQEENQTNKQPTSKQQTQTMKQRAKLKTVFAGWACEKQACK